MTKQQLNVIQFSVEVFFSSKAVMAESPVGEIDGKSIKARNSLLSTKKISSDPIAIWRMCDKIGTFLVGNGNHQRVHFPKGFFIIIFVCLFFEVMHINGIYHNRTNFLKISSALTIYSFAIQMIASLIARASGKELEPILKAHRTARKFYETEQKNLANWPILMKTLKNATRTFKGYMVISFVMYHTPVITSLIVSLWKRDFIMAFCVYVPFTDPETLYGFVLNMILHIFATFLFYVLFMMRDGHMIYWPLQLFAMTDMFALKMRTFGEQLSEFHKAQESLKDDAGPSTSRLQNIQKRVVMMIRRQKELQKLESQFITLIKDFEVYNSFIETCISYGRFAIFLALSANSAAIGLALLYIKLVSIPIGVALAAIFFFQVLIPCMIGAVVSSNNEKLLLAACEFPWYELSPKMRKVYLQFIHQCQNTNEYELPVIGELNMELFTDVMNTSYSYLTYLLNFL
jgi:hypothetical protein